MERLIKLSVVETQTRFEKWASEDIPVVIDPETLRIGFYQDMDLPELTNLYMSAFNSQNKRKYAGIDWATLVWDEEPWTLESAREQLMEELKSKDRICFVAEAQTPNGKYEAIGFILARSIDETELGKISGSVEVSKKLFDVTGAGMELVLWEDTATYNLRDFSNKTVRGLGTSLFMAMENWTDKYGKISIARTGPGSYTERILGKVGFIVPNPKILDSKDVARYWFYRMPKK